MSKHQLVFGLHAVLSLLEQSPHQVVQLYTQNTREDQQFKKIIFHAQTNGIAHEFLSREKLDLMLPNVSHQGVIAKCCIAKNYSEKDIPELFATISKDPFLLILDGIQDPHNLGACLRTANAAGVHLVIAPRDKSVALTPVARKVACGAAEVIPFVQVTNLARTLRWLKEQGVWIFGTADSADIGLFTANFHGSIAFVLGAEGKGIRRLTRELCDYVVSIPMKGAVSSLNVSVAAGVCLFEALRQRTTR